MKWGLLGKLSTASNKLDQGKFDDAVLALSQFHDTEAMLNT